MTLISPDDGNHTHLPQLMGLYITPILIAEIGFVDWSLLAQEEGNKDRMTGTLGPVPPLLVTLTLNFVPRVQISYRSDLSLFSLLSTRLSGLAQGTSAGPAFSHLSRDQGILLEHSSLFG